MNTERPASAGWYEDPDDPTQLRYFDGVVWSTHVTPRQTRHPMPPSADPGWSAPGSPMASANPYAGPPTPAPAYPGHTAWGVGPQGYGPEDRPLAQWWQRLFASWIDSIVVGVLVAIIGWPWLSKFVALYGEYLREVASAAEAGLPTPSPDSFVTQGAEFALPLALISVAVSLVYQTVFLVWKGATPGKMVLGVRVVQLDKAPAISLVTALRRQAIQVGCSMLALAPVVGILGSMLSALDNAWLLWDPKKQCLHDKVAQTVVVKAR